MALTFTQLTRCAGGTHYAYTATETIDGVTQTAKGMVQVDDDAGKSPLEAALVAVVKQNPKATLSAMKTALNAAKVSLPAEEAKLDGT